MKSQIHSYRYRQGFTLIELIMVLLVISIVAAVILSPKQNILGIRTRQAALKISSDIRYAQSYALSSQQRTRLAFDAGADKYDVYIETSSGSWSYATDPLSKDNFSVDFTARDFSGVDIVQVLFNSIDYHLVFDASGTPYSYNPAGSTSNLLINTGVVTLGGAVSVKVEPQTGKVSIAP